MKTSKIQAGQKKQKVENYERLFSLSSYTSRTSQVLEDSLNADPLPKAELAAAASKRNRFRTGKTKGGGKTLMRDDGDDDDDNDSGDNDDIDESIEDSVSKKQGRDSKKKKIKHMRKG